MTAPLLSAIVRDGTWAPTAPLQEPPLRRSALAGVGLWQMPDRRSTVPVPRPALFVGNLGACETRCLYVLVSDDSPSVTGHGGNDPLANRYTEAQAAFRALARVCSCGRCLGAVVHFDQVGGAGPVPVREWRRGRRRLSPRLEAALSTPADAVGTSRLGPSLKQALRLIKAHPTHRAVLIVASDFQLFDEEPGRVIAKLDRFAVERGSVHAVVLGRPIPDGVLSPPIVTHVVHPGSVPGALARAVARGLAEYRTGTAIPDDVAPTNAADADSAA